MYLLVSVADIKNSFVLGAKAKSANILIRNRGYLIFPG